MAVLALTLVVDSNILFAATIKNGDNAKLLLSDRIYLIAPERLFEELKNIANFCLLNPIVLRKILKSFWKYWKKELT